MFVKCKAEVSGSMQTRSVRYNAWTLRVKRWRIEVSIRINDVAI